MKTLDPCAWRYVLTQDDLASFRLQTRSDVVGAWEIASHPNGEGIQGTLAEWTLQTGVRVVQVTRGEQRFWELWR